MDAWPPILLSVFQYVAVAGSGFAATVGEAAVAAALVRPRIGAGS
jgi:hypothetical protein